MPVIDAQNIDQLLAKLIGGARDEKTIAGVIELLGQLGEVGNPTNAAALLRKNLLRSEEKLRRTLLTLEFHIDNSPIAVTEWGPDFRWTRWSAGAERVFGHSADEMLGRRFLDQQFIHPDDLPVVQAHMQQLLSGEITRFSFTNRNLRKDGSIVWCHWHNSALMDDEGNIVSVLSHASDVTDRVNAEHEARHARDLLEAHLNNLTVAIVEWGPDRRVTRWSAGATRLLGWQPEQVIGRQFHQLEPPIIAAEDLQRVMEHTEELIGGRTRRASITVRNHRPDGTIRWMAWHSSSVFDDAGSLVSILSQGIDVTERMLAETLLRESEMQFRAAFDLATVGMGQIDARTLRFVSVNRELCRLSGYSTEELRQLTVVDLIHPDDRAAGIENRAQLLRGEPLQFAAQRRIVRKNGQVLWIHFAVNTMLDAAGRPERVLGAVFDITDRVRAEHALRAAKERAEAASQAKDRFIATLSHELRTPLTPVRALLSFLVDDQRIPADVRADLQLVLSNVRAECRLIDDLLDMTRLVRGQVEVELSPGDVHEIINQVIETAAVELDQKQLDLDMDQRAGDAIVMRDDRRLRQVFWNLMSNAIKFTPPGGKITIETDNPTGTSLRVRVSDTGVGIAPQYLQQIFEPFERGETRHRYEYTGLGLGLSIARSLLDLMKGSIEAQSAGGGKGATFTVTLPLAGRGSTRAGTGTSAVAKAADASSAARAGSTRPAGSPVPVLIVEDHASTAEILARLLQRNGYAPSIAPTVAAAQRLVAGGKKFDLLLCDIGLPDGTGHDLLMKLRADGVTAPAIALSGYGMSTDIAASRAAGFLEHLTKPIDYKTLEAALRRATGREVG